MAFVFSPAAIGSCVPSRVGCLRRLSCACPDPGALPA